MPESNDWFAAAAVEAERTKVAKIAARRQSEIDEKRKMNEAIERQREVERNERRIANMTRPDEAAKAAALFKAVAEGTVPVSVNAGNPPFSTGGGIPPRKIKGGIAGDVPNGAWNGQVSETVLSTLRPEEALEVILRHVRNAGSPDKVFAASGLWMGKVTNALSAIARATAEEE
jgi:hypothetical protein